MDNAASRALQTTGGSVYIEYKGTGIEQAAEFVYSGCNMFKVKNAS